MTCFGEKCGLSLLDYEIMFIDLLKKYPLPNEYTPYQYIKYICFLIEQHMFNVINKHIIPNNRSLRLNADEIFDLNWYMKKLLYLFKEKYKADWIKDIHIEYEIQHNGYIMTGRRRVFVCRIVIEPITELFNSDINVFDFSDIYDKMKEDGNANFLQTVIHDNHTLLGCFHIAIVKLPESTCYYCKDPIEISMSEHRFDYSPIFIHQIKDFDYDGQLYVKVKYAQSQVCRMCSGEV